MSLFSTDHHQRLYGCCILVLKELRGVDQLDLQNPGELLKKVLDPGTHSEMVEPEQFSKREALESTFAKLPGSRLKKGRLILEVPKIKKSIPKPVQTKELGATLIHSVLLVQPFLEDPGLLSVNKKLAPLLKGPIERLEKLWSKAMLHEFWESGAKLGSLKIFAEHLNSCRPLQHLTLRIRN
jgi:hypothetical protein